MKKRIPLFFDKTLSLQGIQYEIINIAGEGGSCIVYNAIYRDSVGTPHHVRIKELYPLHLHAMRTEDNVLSFLEKDVFQQYRQRFLCAAELQQEIRTESGIVNVSARLYDTAEANGTIYQILEYYNGVPFSLSCTGNLEKYLSALLQTAEILKKYHQNGYLHLDLKPDNLYYLLPQYDALHTYGKVLVLDFDSILRREEANTAVRSYSAGYSAPELKNGAFVSEKTDFYSIGAMLFETIQHRFPTILDGDFFAEWDFDRKASVFQNVEEKFFNLLTDFFHKTLSTWTDDRYSNDDELIFALEELRKAANVSQPYLESNFSVPVNHCFIGRMQELKEIQDKLRASSHVFLQGVGGNGKTFLAMQYAWQQRTEYEHIVFARYCGSFMQMLCDDFSIPIGNLSAEEVSESYAEKKFNLFRDLCNSRVLLILDNCDFKDAEEVSKLEKWLKLPCHLLITTRMQLSENTEDTLMVTGLHEAEELFQHYCTRKFQQKEQACIHQLLDYIEHHTMTTELLAKLMRDSNISPEQVYEQFLAADIRALSEQKVKNVKDANYQNQSVNTYMDILFALFDFSAEEKLLLQSLVLLADKAFYRPLFLEWCPFVKESVLNHLIYKGWIQEDRIFKLLLLHPVIADRLLLHLAPDAEKMETLLNSLNNKLCNMRHKPKPFIEICLNIEKYIHGSSRALAFMQYQLGQCTEDETALQYYSKASAFYSHVHDTEMLKKIEILEFYHKIRMCLFYDWEEAKYLEMVQKYLELLNAEDVPQKDPYFCLSVGNYCQTLAKEFQMLIGEESDMPFWKTTEKYYQFAFQAEKTREFAGEYLNEFYRDYFNPLNSTAQAEKYEKYSSMPVPKVILSLSEQQEELRQKENLLSNMLMDDDAEGFSALAKELAEYYLKDEKMFQSFNFFLLQDALKKSGQTALLITILEKYTSEENDIPMRLELAELYLSSGQPEKAFPLLKQEETYQLQNLAQDAHNFSCQCQLAKIYFLMMQVCPDGQEKIQIENTCCCHCNKLLANAAEPDSLIQQETALLALNQAEDSLKTGNLSAAKSFLNFFAFLWEPLWENHPEEVYHSYLKICEQVDDTDEQFWYYYFTFCTNAMENFMIDEEQQAECNMMYRYAAEAAEKTFGINDIRTARAFKKAAEHVSDEERAEILKLINYEVITQYEIQTRLFPHQETNSIHFAYWGKCAKNYRNAGNMEKYHEIMQRLHQEMKHLKTENLSEYFEALKDAENFYLSEADNIFLRAMNDTESLYLNKSDDIEKALQCVLEQWKLLPSDASLQKQFDLCSRIADCYGRLHEVQNEIVWLKKALNLAETMENTDSIDDNLFVNLLDRLIKADSAQKDNYSKRKVKLLQSKLTEN